MNLLIVIASQREGEVCLLIAICEVKGHQAESVTCPPGEEQQSSGLVSLRIIIKPVLPLRNCAFRLSFISLLVSQMVLFPMGS